MHKGWMMGACALAAAGAWPVAAGAQAPTRRGGLWESHLTGGPMGGMALTMRTCVDPAAERPGASFSSGRRPAACATPPTFSPAPGGGWTFHEVCRPGNGMTMETTGVATGDFATTYILHATTRMTPAPIPALAVSETTVSATWLGPCPAGMKPGTNTINGRTLPAASR